MVTTRMLFLFVSMALIGVMRTLPWNINKRSNDGVTVKGYCGAPVVDPSGVGQVVGVEDAASHSWPWQVSISREGQHHFCAGALISSRWIITAAHCAGGGFDDSTTVVGLGVHNKALINESTMVEARIEAHFEQDFDFFKGGDLDNDIALIKLDRDIEYTPEISPACLPHAGEELSAGTDCYSTGWGSLNLGGPMPVLLQQAMIPVLDRNVCNSTREFFEGDVTENMICAGYDDGRTSSCHGDSGGPLVCPDQGLWVLYGVVSWGEYCQSWTIFTRVANYIPWIERIMTANP